MDNILQIFSTSPSNQVVVPAKAHLATSGETFHTRIEPIPIEFYLLHVRHTPLCDCAQRRLLLLLPGMFRSYMYINFPMQPVKPVVNLYCTQAVKATSMSSTYDKDKMGLPMCALLIKHQ